MRIEELVNNAEFTFNVPFRILEYVGTEDDPDKTIKVFDSAESGDVPFDVMHRYISAVNEGDDGVIEIEYVRLIGEE